jgi:hypothetical protein
MALKCQMDEAEIERQLIFDIDSDSCSEDDGNCWEYGYEDDGLVQPLLPSTSSSLSS